MKDNPKELYKVLFNKIKEHIIKKHFPESPVVPPDDSLPVIHRAYFYFKLEVMLHEYRHTQSDKWGVLHGINTAYHLLSKEFDVPIATVIALTSKEVAFILAEDVERFTLSKKIMDEIKLHCLSSLQAQPIQSHLRWDIEDEWPVGIAEGVLYSETQYYSSGV